MKQILIFLISILSLAACSTADKAVRDQQKAINRQLDSLKAVAAMDALKECRFQIAVDRVTLKHGGSFNSNATINFISLNGDQATVQLASPVLNPGPNGMGGFTLSGTARNVKLTIDKKGNATLAYVVSGMGLTADISIKLSKGQQRAIATVDAGYSTAGMTVEGVLSSFNPTSVVKGTSF